MEREKEKMIPEEQTQVYTPRPAWQVHMARVGLVIFILFVIWQAVQLAGGFV